MIFLSDIPLSGLWQRPQELAIRLKAQVYVYPGKLRFGFRGTWGAMRLVAVPVWHFRSKYRLLNWFCLHFSGALDPIMRAVQRYYFRRHGIRNLKPVFFVESVQLSHLAHGRIHFDYIDRHDFGSRVPRWFDERFRDIARRADTASATHPLLGAELGRPWVHVPNAYNKSITDHVKVYGYWGYIGGHIDWQWILGKLEDPGAIVIMVGECRVTVPDHPRLHVWPAVPHHTLPALARLFDVGIIPWKHTRLTEAVDPVKAYEYKALGLPVESPLSVQIHPGTWNDRVITLKIQMEAR